jgi:hypothetical protein
MAAAKESAGVVKVTVTGLPGRHAVTTARVRVIGPTGSAHSRTWRVGAGKTVEGLKPGLYVVQARKAKTRSGKGYAPDRPYQWVKVRDGSTAATVKVKYSEGTAGTVYVRPLSMEDACRRMKGAGAEARYRNYEDPNSWYCVKNGNNLGGLDLDEYCSEVYGDLWYAWDLAPKPNVLSWRCYLGDPG